MRIKKIIIGILVLFVISFSAVLIIKNIKAKNENSSPKNFYGVEFNDASYKYDGKNKKIYVKNPPEFSTITYSCTLEDGTTVNKNYFSEPGKYVVEATIKKENYNTLILSATLSILRAYKINFHINDSTVIPLEVFEGESLDRTLIPSVEKKIGKSGKWSINDFENIQSDLEVYPVYEDEKYRITYILNGGEITEDYIEYFYASDIEDSIISLPIPVRYGYYFGGWYSEGTFKNAVDCINLPKSYVLHAYWKTEEKALKYEIVNDYAVVVGIDEEYVKEHKLSYSSIVIPDTYNNYPVKEIASSAFAFDSSILYVTIGDNVTKIGDSAFKSCGKLLSVSMGDSVEEIGSYCFANCFSLERVNLSNTLQTISEGMFFYCQSLTQIIIPGSIGTISNKSFDNCTKMEYILFDESIEIFQIINIECEIIQTVCYYSDELEFDGENHYWCYNEKGLIIIK